MEIYSIITTLTTLIASGGWFVFYKANKRKKEGEATQSEAQGWKDMQELYQKTIKDFDGYCEDMRKERGILKSENSEMREKYKKMDDEILKLKRQLARQGRKLEALSPFLCSVVGCVNRKKVSLSMLPTNDDNEEENENDDNKQE